jgi:hypothetical protein
MFRRRPPVSHRGPGLARTVARTAVISGTATATSGAVASRQVRRHAAAAQEATDNQRVAELEQQVEELQQQEVQQDITAAPAAGDDLAAQIARLGELHAQGVLSAEEFTAAKAQLLGI